MSQIFDHTSGDVLEHDGAQIYYEITGNPDGQVLLYLHGGFGHIADINGILPLLANQYKILGIDSRGHGRSTMGEKPLSYALLQSDVEAVLKHLGIDTLSILGFSDGGVVAYRLAISTSHQIKKIATIGGSWRLQGRDDLKKMFQKLTGDIMKQRQPAYYEAYQQLNPNPDFDLLIHKLVDMWLDTTETGYPSDQVNQIKCPLLVIRGDKDHLFSAQEMLDLANQAENAAMFNIPLAGHAAFQDQPELFTLGLTKFLNEQALTKPQP